MKRLIPLLLILSSNFLLSQDVLILGNSESITLKKHENISYTLQDKLPTKLDSFDCIFIFSNATNSLTPSDFNRILDFTAKGKGLYCGAENNPLNAEFDALLKLLTGQVSYGKYECKYANYDLQSNLKQENTAEVKAGNSTVSFPLDHRMQVDLWVEDQPLIASMNYEKGRIILDGGYSRFYAVQSEDVALLWEAIIKYLCNLDYTH